MKRIRFLFQKILIVESMLIILFLICNWIGISMFGIDLIISNILKVLTPISVIVLMLYIIFSFFNFRLIEMLIGILFCLIIGYYVFVK